MPEDEKLEDENQSGDELDEDLDDGVADDDDDDLEGVEAFDPELVTLARAEGINPADYTNSEDLYKATESRIRVNELKNIGAKTTDEQKLVMDAIDVALKSDDVDPSIIKTFEEMASATGKNLEKLVAKLESRKDVDAAVQKQIEVLTNHIHNLSSQNTHLKLDNWISRHAEVHKYLGKDAAGEMATDSIESRRRRALISRATKTAEKITRQGGSWTVETLFARSYKAMTKNKSSSSTGKKEPTRVARASGTKTTDFVAGAETADDAATAREAADVVRKFRKA